MRSITYIFTIIISMFVISNSYSGEREVGNGGAVWSCEKDGVRNWLKVVDLFEAEEEFHLSPRVWKETKWENIVEEVSAVFEATASDTYFEYKTYLDKILRRLTFINSDLSIINDSNFRIVPRCVEGSPYYRQIANYTLEEQLLIEKDLWNDLTEVQKAAVIIHEAIYTFYREIYQDETSLQARKAVGYLFSNVTEGILRPVLLRDTPILEFTKTVLNCRASGFDKMDDAHYEITKFGDNIWALFNGEVLFINEIDLISNKKTIEIQMDKIKLISRENNYKLPYKIKNVKYMTTYELNNSQGTWSISMLLSKSKKKIGEIVSINGSNLPCGKPFGVNKLKKQLKFFEAVMNGNYEKVLAELKNNFNPNIIDRKGDTPLMRAVSYDRFDILKLLLQYSANIQIENKYGENAFNILISSIRASKEKPRKLNIGRLLIEAGINFDNRDFKSILKYTNDLKLIKAMVDKGAVVEDTDFIYAAANANLELVIYLLSVNKSDVNIKNNDGEDVLLVIMKAKNLNNLERAQLPKILEYLQERGVDIAGKKTELFIMAIKYHNYTFLEYFKNLGATFPNDDFMNNSFVSAAESGNLKTMRFILSNGLKNIDVKNGSHHSAIDRAVDGGHFLAVKFLVENGADINKKTGHFPTIVTPLWRAQRGHHKEIEDYLISKGATI